MDARQVTPGAPDAAADSDFFLNAFHHAAIGMAIVGLDGRFLKVNRSLCEIVGYSEPELLGLDFQTITHPDDLQTDLDHVRDLVAGRISDYHMEKRYFHRDGHDVWILLSVSLVRDEMNKPLQFISQIQDVTSRRATEAALRESETHFRDFFENATDFVINSTIDGRFLYVNKACREGLGYTDAELAGMTVHDIMHPEWVEQGIRQRQLIIENGSLTNISLVFLARDGSAVPVEGSSNCECRDGVAVALRTIFRNVTDRVATETALRERDAILQSFFDNSGVMMGVVEVEGDEVRYVTVNEASAQQSGARPQDMAGKLVTEFGSSRDFVASWVAHYRRARVSGTPEQFEYSRQRDGKTIWMSATVGYIGVTSAGIDRFSYVCHDITSRKENEQRIAAQQQELREANARLHELSRTDGLTGLYNHRAFQERLREEFERARRNDQPLSLLMLDVDYFKRYNDNFGHPAGDEVLKTIAEVLRQQSRTTDFIARYGGEEFAVILPQTDQERSMQIAERFRAAIENANWDVAPVTASIGVSIASRDADAPLVTPAQLVGWADDAMYRSKRAGRNAVRHSSVL